MRNPRRSILVAMIGIVLLVGPAGSTAAAAATITATAATAGTGIAIRMTPEHARHGREQFVMTSRAVSARRQLVRASGMFRARGYAIRGRVVSGRGVASVIFRHGSIRLATDVTSRWASVPNPRSCRFTEVYAGVYRLRGGTRRYAGVSGAGRFTTKISGRLVRLRGSCRTRLASIRISTVTRGSMRW